jgi:hypothetical protein
MAPRKLAPAAHRLPPMLHSEVPRPMTSCSKGAWGLFVLSRGLGILTETAISPSTWSRQCPSRYAIRAGRNLPDKEFRYLRTVIVTAAVYRGFGSKLSPCGVTSPLNLPAPGRRQCVYGALRGFARTCVFAKQSLGPIRCDPPELWLYASPPRASLLPKLRDQYAEFLDHVSLAHLRLLASPTCVGFRYGHHRSSRSSFSGRSTPDDSGRSCPLPSHSRLGGCPPTRLDGHPPGRSPFVPVSLERSLSLWRGRNLRRLPIDYASRASS